MAENRLPKYKFSTPKKEKTLMDYYKVLPLKKTVNNDDNNDLNDDNKAIDINKNTNLENNNNININNNNNNENNISNNDDDIVKNINKIENISPEKENNEENEDDDIDIDINSSKNEINYTTENDFLKEKKSEKKTSIKQKLSLLGKKRLIKQKDKIFLNKIKKHIASNYFDKEAELGSDNEEHDDKVKKIYNSDSELENESEKEKNIPNLIDDETILEENDSEYQEKYLNDLFLKDKEEILKVIEGPQQRNNRIKNNNENNENIINNSDLPLKLRIEKMKDARMNEEDEINEINFDGLVNKFKQLKKAFKEDSNNNELEMELKNSQKNIIEKIQEKYKINKKELIERIKENNKIMENVIILDNNNNNNNNKKKNLLLVKGNNNNNNFNKKYHTPYKLKNLMNNQNSFLANIKKEKNNNNFIKNNLSKFFNNNIKQNYLISPLKSAKKNNNTTFINNLNINANSLVTPAGNLTSLFLKKD